MVSGTIRIGEVEGSCGRLLLEEIVQGAMGIKKRCQTEVPSQFAFERAAGQHVEIGVDGFGRDAHRRIIGIALEQAVGNLFARPAPGQQPEDRCLQAWLGGELSRLWRASSRVSALGARPI